VRAKIHTQLGSEEVCLTSVGITAAAILASTLLIGVVYRIQYAVCKRTQHILVAVHFSSVTVIIVSYCLLCLKHHSPGQLSWLGWTTFALGSVVFWYCTFIHAACLVPDESKGLVSRGPYRFVRHPMYSGGLLAALGLAIVTAKWEVIVAWAVLFAALWWLAFWEELELENRLGSSYRSYRAHTKRLVPGVL
jgi:protein-S-isoprenylcysteine O-methyltransferase Ste14